mgnify:CR=1 FL=1
MAREPVVYLIAGEPSGDAIADTRRFHDLIEDHARRHPAQYLWSYKRFKRPDYDPYRR